jgi:SPX domain protein involved in polyphosphate accumulation
VTWRDRHECKFVVPETVAGRVRQFLLPFVEPDPFAARWTDHTYPIASLYLDNAVNTLYRQTIEGRAHRYKLRVRAYDDHPGSQVFVEVKRRLDRVVQKVRCAIPRCCLPAVLAGNAAVPGVAPQQAQALQEFARLTVLQRAFPRLIVRYRRQAYVGRDEPDVRVTFDRQIGSSPESAPIVRHAGRFEPIAVRGVVLELKFTDRCPSWLQDAVRSCELHRRSFSKYCHGVEAVSPVGHRVVR